jgi:hypothetical protein
MRDSSVGIATGCRFHVWGSTGGRDHILLLSIAFRPTLGPAQPHIALVTEAFFPWDKEQNREAKRLPPSSAEVKNDGAISSFLHMYSWQSA